MAGVPIIYPLDLPQPSAAPITAAERRLLDSLLLDARAFQRDYRAFQSLTFPPLRDSQAADWHDWWKTTLRKGGAWFSSTWPTMEGFVEGVRRFIGTPRWEFVSPSPGHVAGFWRITALCELRGTGEPPVRLPEVLLAAHLAGDFTDLSGHTLAPYDWNGAISNDPIWKTDTPKFGASYLGKASDGLFMNPVLSDLRGNLNLNRDGEWQIRWWARPSLGEFSTTGGHIVNIQGAEWNGNSIGGTPGGATFQLGIRDDRIGSEAAGFTTVRVTYNGTDVVDPAVNSSVLMLETSVGSCLVPIDEWYFGCLCGGGDLAGTTRLYIGRQGDTTMDIAANDAAPPHLAGEQPLWYTKADPFTNQVIIVAAACTGGILPGDIWPTNTTYSFERGGGLQDLLITRGVGSVEFIGDGVTVPTTPFEA